jgi:37-kD nucleoid-associated bacterial protein
MNLDTFQIISAVVHDIPRGGSQGETVVLTDAPIALDDPLRAYFRRKIIQSIGLRGLDVVVDPDGAPCVRDSVAEILADESQLVAASQRVAEHLDAVQTGRNSAGLLTIILGEIDGQRCVSALKLEREQGLRFHIGTDDHGHRVVDLELLRELTLTDKTKVFKTSIFVVGDQPDAHSMQGRVADDQRGRDDGVGVAVFYLSTFLGCQLKTSPEKATLDFVKATESFFNGHVANAERRGRYQVALLSQMQDNNRDVRPRSFAETHLDVEDRAPFTAAIREAGIDPTVAFQKDTSLVKIKGFRMVFESGMVLVGGSADLADRVTIRPDDAAQPGVDINDAVKRLGGR